MWQHWKSRANNDCVFPYDYSLVILRIVLIHNRNSLAQTNEKTRISISCNVLKVKARQRILLLSPGRSLFPPPWNRREKIFFFFFSSLPLSCLLRQFLSSSSRVVCGIKARSANGESRPQRHRNQNRTFSVLLQRFFQRMQDWVRINAHRQVRTCNRWGT